MKGASWGRVEHHHISISRAWSYLTVGITELMNLRKMMRDWWGLTFFPLALDSSLNRLKTQECLQGWMVSILQSKNGQFSSVTVSFWYSEQMSSKICLELRGLPLKSLPLIQSLGVKQYSSQEMYIVYLRQSYSCSSRLSSPLISTKPHSLPPLYVIFCAVSLWMRTTEVAGADRYCFSGFGRDLQGLLSAFCHFQPKLVSWSPACMNCSGESIPLASKSFSEGVNLELKKLFIPSNIQDIIKTWPQPRTRK